MSVTDPLFRRDHSMTVEVIVSEHYRDVVPLMEELGNHFGELRTWQLFPRPYTGSTTGPEWDFARTVTIVITAAGGAEFVRRVIGSLADDAYKTLRAKLLTVGKRKLEWRRVKRGVIIRVGSHRFAFDQSITDDQFRHQLRAAQALVDRSPDDLLQPDDPADEWNPWLWSKSEGRWQTSGIRLAQAVGENVRRVD